MIVREFEKYLGVGENPPNSNKNLFTQWYFGNDTGAPWCMISLSYVLSKLGYNIKYANCEIFRHAFIRKKVNISTCQRNDIVLFDWDKDGTADHVGVVVEYNGKIIKTIEGNTGNNKVEYKHRYTSDVIACIRLSSTPTLASPPELTVVEMQRLLNKKCMKALGMTLKEDGIKGKNTTRAVKIFQAMMDLEIDGICGAKTWRELKK